MDITHIRPTWLTSLLPLLAVYQYGDREIVRAELFRMALSADAAACDPLGAASSRWSRSASASRLWRISPNESLRTCALESGAGTSSLMGNPARYYCHAACTWRTNFRSVGPSLERYLAASERM